MIKNTIIRKIVAEISWIFIGLVFVTITSSIALHLINVSFTVTYLLTGVILSIIFSLVWSYIYINKIKRIGVEQLVSYTLSLIILSSSIFVLVPITIERSISVFLFKNMKNEISMDDLQGVFEDRYICNNAAVNKRMHEQSALGWVNRSNDGIITLTSRGQVVFYLIDVLDKLYAVPHKENYCKQ